MTRTDFYFDSRDNRTKIHGVKWVPDTAPIGIIILVHGMAEHIERYEPFAKFMCERGFIVAGNDHLGHGKSLDKEPQGYFCRRDPATVLVRDVHRIKKSIQNEYPRLPIFILGHSMGSLIARNYITKYGSGISGAVLSGTLMMPRKVLGGMGLLVGLLKFFQGSRHKSKLLNRAAFGTYCNRIENPRTSFDWLTRDDEEVSRYIADPDCGFCFTINGFGTLRELCARLYNEDLLKKIPKDLPILFIYGGQDPCGEYGDAVRRVYDQYLELGIKDVTEKEYPEDRHELLNELDKETVMSDIHSWLKERMQRLS